MDLRRILIWLVNLGMIGLIAELILLEHTETLWQWIPLTAIALGLALSAWVSLGPTVRTLQGFRAVMILFVLSGGLGLYLHFEGNVEFELENDPSRKGVDLIWEALRGATPTLAPGALAQIGLLGLAFTHKHPALR